VTLSIAPFFDRLYQQLKASFWLIPLCMVGAALILGPAVVEYDLSRADSPDNGLIPGLRLSEEGARMILSAIAGSMITVASLVFSMTLVALSLVAQQLGPRILQIFMEDRPTQIMLGLFIATFLFAMVVLGSVGFGSGDSFIPTFGVFLSGFLAVVAFIAVILFIHHIAQQIQADVVIHKTAQKLQAAADELVEEAKNNSAKSVDKARFDELQNNFEKDARHVFAKRRSGYVQQIDTVKLMGLAGEHDLQIILLCRPGEFVLNGRPLLTATPAANLDDDIAGKLQHAVLIRPQRTREQHVEFEMLALVEIALRALSKGINDPFTATSCIDWLSVGLAKLMSRYPDYQIHCDDDDRTRVLEHPQTFERYLKRTINPIREAASDVPLVLRRLDQALTDLRAIADHDAQIRALDEQKDLLKQVSR